MNDKLTILIPTSPIPSHPSTAILDETIANIRKYTDAKIIIMCDGIHTSMEKRTGDYADYVGKIMVKSKTGIYGECHIMVFTRHTHQSDMTWKILNDMADTPLVMFVEHDTSPVGQIPFDEICEMVLESDTINNIRFNIFHTILDEHKPLMLDKEPIFERGIRLVRTIQWSQRPHIAKTQWYKDILQKYFIDADKHKTMIEDVMHSVVQVSYDELKTDIFGLAIYTPEGNQLRSYHSDARGTDEKIIEG